MTYPKALTTLALAALLAACGGGGSDAPDTDAATPPVEIVLSESAPLDNLDLAAFSNFVTAAAGTHCGYPVPSKSISGVVSSVHDGDTVTVNGTNIRLDSIDAPELKQTYGTQSRDNLSNLVLGKPVVVYYAKIDKYGRTVGSVFTSSCDYANLQQVRAGAAWHYKQYQCEQPAALRSEFSAAQAAAEAADRGLWASAATPPWVYRNGVEATTPTCASANPSWYIPPASQPTYTPPTYTPPIVTPPASTCFRVWVNGYRRANGTWVNGYYRNSPGCP